MSGVEWVETAEEVVETEDRLPSERISPTVIHVLEAETTPIQKLLNSVGQGETPQDGFYCEECVSLFQDQNDSENISGPSFVLDFPTTLGVPQRALLTLPYGLMIGRSSIPNAGIGVVNHGPAVSPGMHFGPYEGEVTTRENASDFSWEVYKGKDHYEYIDAAKESHSNWLRYINCARSRDESNLLAVQYKGSILFHCCRTISPGDELMVWPSNKLLSHCSSVWSQRWNLKLNVAEAGPPATPQMFLCSHCQLAFTTEAFLQRHIETSHTQLQTSEAADHENAHVAGWDQSAVSSVATSGDSGESKTCGDCGKVFKQLPHLRRHKLCVHSNKRPYCCPHCRRSFSQASGLIRHQLVHRKHTVIKEHHQSKPPCEESRVETAAEPLKSEEPEKSTASKVSQDAETAPFNCTDCRKSFANEASLKKHRMFVHENLRPYVCTVCQKCFGQCHDLSRHLWSHKNQNKKRGTVIKEPENSISLVFSCSGCPMTFPSVDALQEHVKEAHSEASVAESQDVNPLIVVEVVQDVPSQRPQRLEARSKILAITKLLSPKRRASSPAGSRQSPTPPETAAEASGNPTKTKWFCCSRCKQTYGNSADLKAHQCTSKPHKCGECGAAFGKPGFLKRHQTTAHAKTKSYSCERCRKVFTTCGNLKQHQKINTCMKYHCTSELFPCSYCQFSFSVKSYLLKHIKRHHPVEYLALCDSDNLVPLLQDEEEEEEEEEAVEEGGDKEHVCQECGKMFPSSKAFKSHKCPPQVKVLYLCTDCGKGFSNHYGLKQHQRIHTGEKPYSCPHCSKSFSYVGQLNVHLRTHTGEKPYLCTHCGESFRQSGDLKRHERKHTGVRPYSCPECSKSFSRPQSLKAHQMLHRGQRMFKCTQCGKSFSRNYHLRRHHQKMHT